MRACISPLIMIALLIFAVLSPARAQQTVDAKVRSIADTLVILCMAGGSESTFTAQGDLELRSKLKDILSGNIGAGGGAKTEFTQQKWEGIIGGISKDMTNIQGEQATEVRKCMRENGFNLVNKALSE